MATNGPWWFTASGVLPGPYLVIADSGTMVSWLVLTAAAEEALPLPVLANALFAALRAELEAMEAALVVLLLDALLADELLLVLAVPAVVADLDVVEAVTVPTTALVVSVPEAVPPEVLT